MRILVPFRGDSVPAAALPEADRLARVLDGQVVLVALGPELAAGKGQKRKTASPKHFDGRVQQRIEPARDPVRGILHAASEEKADMIALLPGGLAETDGMDEHDLQKELQRKGRIPVKLIGQEGPD